TDKRLVVAKNADGRVLFDVRPCLLNLLLVDQHSAGKDERLAALPRGREPALQEQFVEPRFHRARLARWRPPLETVVTTTHRPPERCSAVLLTLHSALRAVHCGEDFRIETT